MSVNGKEAARQHQHQERKQQPQLQQQEQHGQSQQRTRHVLFAQSTCHATKHNKDRSLSQQSYYTTCSCGTPNYTVVHQYTLYFSTSQVRVLHDDIPHPNMLPSIVLLYTDLISHVFHL